MALACSGTSPACFAKAGHKVIGFTQRAQYPLIKEKHLNHNMKPPKEVLSSLGRVEMTFGS